MPVATLIRCSFPVSAVIFIASLANAQTAAPLPSMSADANPSFEAATIKPSASDQQGGGYPSRGREFHAVNRTVIDLVRFAYGVQAKQIVDGPDWLDKDHFDISGVPDTPGQPTGAQWKTMMKRLLADRFKLVFRNEHRQMPVFVLSVAKGGPKLAQSKPDDPSGGIRMRMTREGFVLMSKNAVLGSFASTLQDVVFDRPVIDETGLVGHYDFQVTFAPGGAEFGGMHVPPEMENSSAPSIFTAVQDLGLRLEPATRAVPVIVIVHVERPMPD